MSKIFWDANLFIYLFGNYAVAKTPANHVRELDTIDQMAFLAKGMTGRRLRYRELIS